MNVTGNSKKEKKFISLVVYLHNVEDGEVLQIVGLRSA